VNEIYNNELIKVSLYDGDINIDESLDESIPFSFDLKIVIDFKPKAISILREVNERSREGVRRQNVIIEQTNKQLIDKWSDMVKEIDEYNSQLEQKIKLEYEKIKPSLQILSINIFRPSGRGRCVMGLPDCPIVKIEPEDCKGLDDKTSRMARQDYSIVRSIRDMANFKIKPSKPNTSPLLHYVDKMETVFFKEDIRNINLKIKTLFEVLIKIAQLNKIINKFETENQIKLLTEVVSSIIYENVCGK